MCGSRQVSACRIQTPGGIGCSCQPWEVHAERPALEGNFEGNHRKTVGKTGKTIEKTRKTMGKTGKTMEKTRKTMEKTWKTMEKI